MNKTALGGEIDVLTPGGFGGVSINKSISIVADDLEAGVLVAGTNGIIVNAPGGTVLLRGLDIEGLGTGLNGIDVIAVGALFIEDTTIDGFTQSGIAMQPSSSAELHVTNVIVRNTINSVGTEGTGVSVKPSSGAVDATLDAVTLDRNLIGLDVGNNARATVRNSMVSNNSTAGLQANATAGTATLNVENSVTSSNGVGVQAGGGGQTSTVQLSNVTVNGNTTGIATGSGGTILSFNNNTISGNVSDGTLTGTVAEQ